MPSARGEVRRVQVCVAFFLALAHLSLASLVAAQCDEVAQTGEMRVLTLNLLFSEIEERETRLERVAELIHREDVHVVLLQEVVGGVLAGTEDSSRDLRAKLASRGLRYDLRSRFETGVPGILAVKNAILSRCRILLSLSRTLSIVHEPVGGVAIPVRRQVTMARLHLPMLGDINVYNTHLCAECEPEERLHQVDVLLAFVARVEQHFSETLAFIVGGDFNIDSNLPNEASRRAYAQLTDGLLDTYAEVNECESCCSATEGFEGCTFGVPGNPFSDGMRQRIDYLFIQHGQLTPVASQVVFNGMTSKDWVSDHLGVLTTFAVHGGDTPLVSAR